MGLDATEVRQLRRKVYLATATTVCCGCLCLIVSPIVATVLYARTDGPDGETWKLVYLVVAWSIVVCALASVAAAYAWERRRASAQVAAADGGRGEAARPPPAVDPKMVGDMRDQVREATERGGGRTGTGAGSSTPEDRWKGGLMREQRARVAALEARLHASFAARMWNLFFDKVYELGAVYVDRGLVSEKDLRNVEPWVAIGLPAVVVADVALRSVADNNPHGLTLSTGRRVTSLTRPRVGPGSDLWRPAMLINALLDDCQLKPAEEAWYRDLCFCGGEVARAEASRPPALTPAGSTRREHQILHVVTKTLEAAVRITALQRYTENFADTALALASLAQTRALAASGGAAGSGGSRGSVSSFLTTSSW